MNQQVFFGRSGVTHRDPISVAANVAAPTKSIAVCDTAPTETPSLAVTTAPTGIQVCFSMLLRRMYDNT